MKMNKFLVFAVILALVSALTYTPSVAAGKPAPVVVQILAVNDFHGAVDASLTQPNKNDNTTWYYRGGAEYLTNFVNTAVATNPNTIKVSAGDMIGASPLLSALFHDEPTIMAFNLMGFDLSNTGNHEFDEGWNELLRMQNGGCHPTDGCYAGVPEFPGASFDYLAANVIRLDNGQTLFASYSVRQFEGVKVGFIGIALETTPTIVVASAVEGLVFEAEVETLGVLPAHQGIGLGRALLHTALRAAAAHRKLSVALSVAAANERALALYLDTGFRVDDVRVCWEADVSGTDPGRASVDESASVDETAESEVAGG